MRWQFILTDEKAVSPAPVTLKQEPGGWADIVFHLMRDKNYRGLFGTVSSTLDFNGDGFTILRNAFEAYATDADVTIEILSACDDCDNFEQFFLGKISFGDIEFQEGYVCLAKCSIQEFGALAMLQRRADQKVDLANYFAFDNSRSLPHYDGLGVDVKMEPRAINLIANCDDNSIYPFQNTDNHTVLAGSPGTTRDVDQGQNFWGNFSPPDNNLNQIYGQNLTVIPSGQGNSNNDADVPTILVAPIDGEYTVNLDFEDIIGVPSNVELFAATDAGLSGCVGSCGGPLPYGFSKYRVKVKIEIAGIVTDIFDTGDVLGCWCSNDPQTANLTGKFSISGTMVAGDAIRIWISTYQFGNYHTALADQPLTFSQHISLKSKVFISVKTTFEPTNAKNYLVNETLSRITEIVTNGEMRVKSDYFGRTDSQPYPSGADGPGSLLGLTTGLMLRNAVAKDSLGNYVLLPRIQLSFKEMFDALNSIHNIGMGIEDDPDRVGQYKRFRIEPIEYFYDDTVVLTCDGIFDVSISSKPDECVAIFKNGYSKFEAEKYTGLDEFNSTREYRTSLQQIETVMDMTCQFVASGYCIEVTRQMQFDLNLNQDWRLDNEIFAICLKRGYLSAGEYFDDDGNTIPNALHLGVELGDGSSHPPVMSSNIFDPPSVYNMRISPLRNLLRWCKSILKCYSSSQLLSADFIALYFSKGTGNYFARGYSHSDYVNFGTTVPLENSNIREDLISLNDNLKPIVKPQIIKFMFPLSFKDYKAINANPSGKIRCRWGQNTDFVDCWIDQVDYYPNNGNAKFQLVPAWD